MRGWGPEPTRQLQARRTVSVLLTCLFSSCHPQIREQNLQDIKTAGPQSQVLSGVVMDRSLVQVSAQNGSAVSGWGLCDRLLQVTLKLGEDDYEVSVLGTQSLCLESSW